MTVPYSFISLDVNIGTHSDWLIVGGHVCTRDKKSTTNIGLWTTRFTSNPDTKVKSNENVQHINIPIIKFQLVNMHEESVLYYITIKLSV